MKTIVRLAGSLLVIMLAVGTATRADAQGFGIAPHVGYHFDLEEVNLGATAQFTLPGRVGNSQLIAAPGLELYPFIPGNASVLAVNLDLLYPVPTTGPVSPYLGAGLVVMRTSVSAGNITISSTDSGLNLKGGAFFNRGQAISPFAEGALVLANGSSLVIRGGIRFRVGR